VGPGYAPGSVNLKSHVLQAGIFAWGTTGSVTTATTPAIRQITSLSTPITANVNTPDTFYTAIHLLHAVVVEITPAVLGISAATYGIQFTLSGGPLGGGSTLTIAYLIGNTYDTSVPPPIVATGGTITTSGGYRIHTFTNSGTFTLQYPSRATVQYLVVGGGGGGGCFIAGGGGAGAVVTGTASLLAYDYPVTVGNGGLPGFELEDDGNNGEDSILGGLFGRPATATAIGGGGGGYLDNNGLTGACGGGGGGFRTNSTTGGVGTQGFSGGNGPVPAVGQNGGAGGGGAGGAGVNKTTATSAGTAGGVGVLVAAPFGGLYYGGGGGGGADANALPFTGGAGGTGGGGAGGNGFGFLPYTGTNGTDGRGGGGGGGGNDGTGNDVGSEGGNGGKGIVIVAYLI